MIEGQYVVNGDRHDGLQVISSSNLLMASPLHRLCELSYNYDRYNYLHTCTSMYC